MRFKKWVRDLIIGEDKFIESYGEFKQAMLSGQFAMIGMLLCLVYLLFDIALGTMLNIPVFLGSHSSCLGISIVIHRHGNHSLANYFLLPTLNITLYLLAASESPKTGSFIFFIVNCNRSLCRLQLSRTIALNTLRCLYLCAVCVSLFCRLQYSAGTRLQR